MPEWLSRSTPGDWDTLANDSRADHEVADCGSSESHELRLRALLRIPLRSGESIADVGCGTGRLADLLPQGVSYLGVDWSPKVVDLARSRRPAARFEVASVFDVPTADWIVASGPFNYSDGWSKDQTRRALATMWTRARRGIAVTVLRVPTPERLSYQPSELVPMLDGRWGHLEFDQSYLPNDVCVRAWRNH